MALEGGARDQRLGMARVRAETWLRTFSRAPIAGTQLYCFPHAGGSAGFFRGWGNAVPGVSVSAVQYPGREDRMAEPLIASLHELVELIGTALLPELPARFALFGHSMGAKVAFGVAHWLTARGRYPCCLLVSACSAPNVPATTSLHLASDRELVGELERLNGTPRELLRSSEYRAVALPIVRNDYQLLETHRPERVKVLPCPIVACCGKSDPEVDPEQMREWASFSNHGFRLIEAAGDHFYLRAIPNELSQVLEALASNRK